MRGENDTLVIRVEHHWCGSVAPCPDAKSVNELPGTHDASVARGREIIGGMADATLGTPRRRRDGLDSEVGLAGRRPRFVSTETLRTTEPRLALARSRYSELRDTLAGKLLEMSCGPRTSYALWVFPGLCCASNGVNG